jgi:hypothetical protein
MAYGVWFIALLKYYPAFNYVTALTIKQISSDRPDLHSGIEGGAVAEPMVDMFVALFYIHAQIFLIPASPQDQTSCDAP